MAARKPRGLRPDEKKLWDKVRQNTVPLQRPKSVVLAEAIEKFSAPAPKPSIPLFRIGQKAGQAIATAPMMPGAAVRMDSKKLGKMKKGKLSPEARIDLHGMTLAEAHPALTGFVMTAHAAGHRLVLVITGKGKATQDDDPIPMRKGVLKHNVPTWLAQAPLGSVVQQVVDAHVRHGGGGALYVYLRRRR
ncbi:MAG: Smr/MutS family protein [Paracoccaceae bacterium]